MILYVLHDWYFKCRLFSIVPDKKFIFISFNAFNIKIEINFEFVIILYIKKKLQYTCPMNKPKSHYKTPYYIHWTKQYFYDIKLEIASRLITEAIESNRYYNVYYNINQRCIKEGIDPCIGPTNLDHEFLITEYFGQVSWETILIKDYLDQINMLGEKFGIKTIQSQPSYYVNLNLEPGHFNTYFNLPFVELIGPINWIRIFKQIQSDPRLLECYFDTNFEIPQTEFEENLSIRFCIVRPFVDFEGNQISGFSDIDFFSSIIQVFWDITNSNEVDNLYEEIKLDWIDPELSKDLEWFVLDENNTSTISVLSENKYENNLGYPLTILNVRYCPNCLCFIKPID